MAENSSLTDGASLLLDLLQRVGREEPGTVGFGRPRQGPARRAPLVLIAALPTESPKHVAAAREAGADAVFVPLSAEAAHPAVKTGDGSPWPLCGIVAVAQHVAPADLARWQAEGIDAVALQPRDALAACFSPRRQGLLALLDQHLPLEGLRAAGGLAVEGFVLRDTSVEGRLTGDDLLWLSLAAGLVRGPALLLSSRIVAEDLEALVAAGLVGIAAGFQDGSSVEQVRASLAELRGAIDGLDPHLRQGRRERAGLGPVTIPFSGPQGRS